jgi:dipeptidyl aminopeptidase/acylaminoacyl peptidase
VGRAGLAGRAGQAGQTRRGRLIAGIVLCVLCVVCNLPGPRALPGLRDLPGRAALHAQAKHPFTLIELAELPRLFSPQLSPDGRTLVYFLGTADWKANRLVYHLWRQAVGGAPQQLTFTEGGDIPIVRWSPDGTTLLFMREGQLWLMAADGGEPRALSRHATGVSAPAWSPDGTLVYFLATDARTAEERDRDRVRDDVFAVDESAKNRHLWKIVVSTGAETAITSGDATIIEYKVSGDGRHIAYERAPAPSEGEWYRAEVWVMDASGANARALTSNSVQEFNLDISPDGSQVLFVSEASETQEPFFPAALFVVPASGAAAARPAVPGFSHTYEAGLWMPDGRTIVASVNMGVHSEFFLVDVTARRARQITDGAHYIPPGWSLVPTAERIVFQLDEPSRYGDAWTLTTRGDASPTRVTGLFDRMDREIAVPAQDKVSWKGDDGATVEGVLFYPIGYERGKKYPLVVQMHGGPMESDKFGAGAGLVLNYVPVLAAKGYAVLRPNYRGSTGYGTAVFRDVVNGYFHHMTSDITLGVDHLVATGVVDPDKVAIMGASAGGTLVNKLITVTDRFKAASATAGVADWISLWGQSDNVSFRRTWFGGTPWRKETNIAAFWGNSPAKDAANVKTPTLFFAGDADIRVPMAQSIEMYRALKSHGVPTHLYIVPREVHNAWGDLRHQVFKANAELEWFEKYALGRSYTWEKPPQP